MRSLSYVTQLHAFVHDKSSYTCIHHYCTHLVMVIVVQHADINKLSQGSHHIQSSSDWQIFERGCLRAGEEWMEANLIRVVMTGLTVGVFQVYVLLGLLLA